MAKYTPTLLGQDTEVNVGQFFQGGFIDAGSQQLNQAIQNNIKVVTEAKNKKFEQAQALRDGIVSGHFSDAMADEVGGYIEQLTDMPTYSKAYASTLAKANATLGVMVAKQEKITTQIDQTQTQFDADPSSKYYDPNLGARLYDQINGDEENGIVGTKMDTTSNDIQGAVSSFKNNIENIKDGEVRKDFQTQLGEISNQASSTGNMSNVNSEFAKYTTTSDGQKFLSGFSTYDPANGMYVPNFDENSLPPQGLVELYKGVDDSAATLVAAYVTEQQEADGVDDKDMTPALKKHYEQTFLLEEMKKMAPGGGSVDNEKTNYAGRPQGSTPTDNGPKFDDLKDYNSVRIFANNMGTLNNLDPEKIQQAGINYETINIDGEDVRTLDVSSMATGTDYLTAKYTVIGPTGSPSTVYKQPRKTLISIEPNGKKTIIFVGGTPTAPTYNKLNSRTATSFLQNVGSANFGGGSKGTDMIGSFFQVAQSKGELNSDGSYLFFGEISDMPEDSEANMINLTQQAIDAGTDGAPFKLETLQTTFKTTDKAGIKTALEPINKFFLDNEPIYEGLKDNDGGDINGGKKFKVVKFTRADGVQYRDFINSYGLLTYKPQLPGGGYGPDVTVEANTEAMFGLITAGPGQFDMSNAER